MPKKRRSDSPPDTKTYASDDGFVADAPKSKKMKTGKNDKGAERKVEGVEGKRGGAGGAEGQVGKDGEVFWELSSKRRIGVQEFKGNRMINIREYYEKDGEMLPGKKGISLPIEQFNTLITLLPQLETALADKGEKIVRPSYSGAEASAAGAMDEDGDEDGGGVPAAKGKKNFEETSDEEG